MRCCRIIEILLVAKVDIIRIKFTIFAEYYGKGCIDKLRTVFAAVLNPKDAYDKLIKL